MQEASEPAPAAVILLKTKSTPNDPYEDCLHSSGSYNPIFVPVLEHTQINLGKLREAVLPRREGVSHESTYDALIITSQRAVEALASALEDLPDKIDEQIRKNTKIYVVRPATRNTLVKIGFEAKHIVGHESGNGEALAAFIVEDCAHGNKHGTPPSLLFLVGETHRDIISKTLQSQSPPIPVDELIVYETQRRQFENELRGVIDTLDELHNAFRWLVVFSPTGTECALKVMNARMQSIKGYSWRICTIGPTTRDFMIRELGSEPDAVAETPTPEGLLKAISTITKTTKRLSMRNEQRPL